jgi:hypothetical protein
MHPTLFNINDKYDNIHLVSTQVSSTILYSVNLSQMQGKVHPNWTNYESHKIAVVAPAVQ